MYEKNIQYDIDTESEMGPEWSMEWCTLNHIVIVKYM